VTRHPTAERLAQQIVEAFPWQTAPSYLVRDNDGAYGPVFKRRVRAMGIRDRPISPRSPWQNPYAEQLIGTLRRDCLDHVLIFGARHLRRLLAAYSRHYNETRTHVSLDNDSPSGRAIQRYGAIVTTPILSGLHHYYARICEREGIDLPLVPHGQGYKDMSPSVGAFERAVLDAKLCHAGNPLLRWAVSNAAVELDPAGNRKLAKNRSRG
jgi:hypothetical protein